jgi:hypothetical protein
MNFQIVLTDYATAPPASELRASKESPLKGTQTKSEPGLAGFFTSPQFTRGAG